MISLAFLIFTVLFVLAASAQGFSRLWVFVDPTSLLFILSGVAGYFLLFGRKEFGRGVKTFFAFSFPPDYHSSESGQFYLKLSEFTLAWGIFGVFLGLLLVAFNLNPDTVGTGLAISLMSFLYALWIALFVFLPIGLRLSPPTLDAKDIRRHLIRFSLFVLVGFVFLRCVVVIVIFSISQVSTELPPYTFAIALQHAAFAFNPADPLGDYSLFSPYGFWLYYDIASIIIMVAGWWLFRMASGRRRKWIAAPAVILMGLFWSIIGIVIMLSDLNPKTIGTGFLVSMLTTLYGFLAAAGFLIVDMVKSGDYGRVSSSSSDASEGTEQAREIIDRVVEKERGKP